MIKKLINDVKEAPIKPISGYDAAFLYSESPKSPMHVGTLAVIEGSIDFKNFKKGVESKLHMLPKFRQRLVHVPLNLDYPYWADDPNFDLDMQIQHIKLPDPADWETLRELTASIFSRPLDLRRPLWSITFVEGLNNVSQVPEGSVAIVAKIHHVMVDGMSGVGIMGVLFSIFKDEKISTKPIEPFNPDPLPNDFTLLAKSSIKFFKNPLKLPKVAGKTILKLAENRIKNRMQIKNELVKTSFPVPKTIFNQSISPRRTWGTAILSLDRVKALKNEMEVTLNDIILAICSGGIRRYLLEKEKMPSQPLIANVPISIRKKSEKGEMSNKISNMFIPIGTNIEDPIERLKAIQEQTIRGKMKHKALGAKTLAQMADAVPFGLVNLAAGVYSRYNLNEYHRPPFNVTITNIPGPQLPLFLNGHKVLSIFGLTPVVDGLGLIIGIFSYNGQVSITTTSDAKTMPDADVFSRYIRESANELEAIILNRSKKKKKEKKATPKSNLYFNKVRKYYKANVKQFEDLKGKNHIVVTSDVDTITLEISNKQVTSSKKISKKPSVVLTIDSKTLDRIHKGEIKWKEAQIQGRFKITGTEKNIKSFILLLEKINK